MNDDERCCGTGHCMINAEGQCWCGQQWDGEKMCMPAVVAASARGAASLQPSTSESQTDADSSPDSSADA